MRLLGTDVDRVQPPQRVALFTYANAPASAHSDYHVRMAMPLEAREAAGLELEVSHVELYVLAALPNQNLARRAAKIAAPVHRRLVRLELNTRPSKVRAEPPQGVRGARLRPP